MSPHSLSDAVRSCGTYAPVGCPCNDAGVLLAFAIPFPLRGGRNVPFTSARIFSTDQSRSLSFRYSHWLTQGGHWWRPRSNAPCATAWHFSGACCRQTSGNHSCQFLGCRGRHLPSAAGPELAACIRCRVVGRHRFTMSIFIRPCIPSAMRQWSMLRKLAILLASLTAGILGFLWLRLFGKPLRHRHGSRHHGSP